MDLGEKLRIDKQVARYHELREMDEWLGREHIEVRTELSKLMVGLQSECQARPELRDYVTRGLHGTA